MVGGVAVPPGTVTTAFIRMAVPVAAVPQSAVSKSIPCTEAAHLLLPAETRGQGFDGRERRVRQRSVCWGWIWGLLFFFSYVGKNLKNLTIFVPLEDN